MLSSLDPGQDRAILRLIAGWAGLRDQETNAPEQRFRFEHRYPFARQHPSTQRRSSTQPRRLMKSLPLQPR
jgi:hypothetical protein